MEKRKISKLLKKNKIVLIAGTLAVVCFITAISVRSCGKTDFASTEDSQTKETQKVTKMYTWTESENQKNMKDYDWVEQTTYDKQNNRDLSSELFALPFAMSSYYVTNDRLTEVLGNDKVQKYADTATDYLKSMFDNSFRDILANQESFKNTINEYWCNNTDTLHSESMDSTEETTEQTTTVTDNLMQWYVDNQVIMNCDVSTAPCMVFSDDYRYYCRAEIALTMHGGKKAADSFKKLYGMELKEGKTAYYIVEIEFIPNQGISAFNVLMEADH